MVRDECVLFTAIDFLYRLLASRSPYRPTDDSAHELERAICETDPEPPSAASMGLAGAAPIG